VRGAILKKFRFSINIYLGKIRVKSNPINLSKIILFFNNFVYIVMGIAPLEPSVPTIYNVRDRGWERGQEIRKG
jgi:hypothetical protein